MKECIRCLRAKPLEEFHRQKVRYKEKTYLYRASICKKCHAYDSEVFARTKRIMRLLGFTKERAKERAIQLIERQRLKPDDEKKPRYLRL